MKRYTDAILSTTTGLPLMGATVTVRVNDTHELATLFLDRMGTMETANPFVAPTSGFAFYAPDGRYDISVTVGGRTRELTDIDVYDLQALAGTVAALTLAQSGGGGFVLPALFTAIGLIPIPAAIERFTTTGHTIKGIGAGAYAVVPAPEVGGRVAAQSTPWRAKSADGRWWELQPDPHVTFDQLGTVGKAGFEANDIQGWKNITAYLDEKNGGILKGRPTTYAVGEQTQRPGSTVWAYEPSPVLRAIGLTGFLQIDGCGAVLRCRDGLRYGAFKADGTAAPATVAIYPNGQFRSTPYNAMLEVIGCTGGLLLENFKLDGNAPGLMLGGAYGDTGIQIGCGGLGIFGNACAVTIRGINAYDHGQDGLQISAPIVKSSLEAGESYPYKIEDCDFNRNGRQGCSQLGGRGFTYVNCKFRNTSYGRVVTGPCAGFDMEAEGNPNDPGINRDTLFVQCYFTRNRGQNFVADSGFSKGIKFDRCTFIGGGFWTVWLRKPQIVLVDCTIVGSQPTAYDDGGVASFDSTKFIRCLFTNDPAYGQTDPGINPRLIDGGAYPTAALHEQCDFVAVGNKLIAGMAGAFNRYHSCRFSRQVDGVDPLRGIFTGDNVATGPGQFIADGSQVYDRFYINGVKQAVSA